MRIGVIQASSQAAKNQMIYDAVTKHAPKGAEVINFGCTMEENEKYSYIEISILVGILLERKTVDFVVTGCSSGQGMMLACNSMPGVICGYAPTPKDAYLFAQINNGNAISLPLGEDYTWSGTENLEKTIEALFSEPFGQEYPKSEAERKNMRVIMLKYREITESDNAAVAALVRDNLKQFNLDIPGTVYFDAGLDHLSDYYGSAERRYFVIESDNGEVIGGIGFDRFEPMKDTAELQKLYLTDAAKGSGLGYELIDFIENKMRAAGYKASYLETHNNLQAAIHIYEKTGYKEIKRPKEVVHSTMNRFFRKEL